MPFLYRRLSRRPYVKTEVNVLRTEPVSPANTTAPVLSAKAKKTPGAVLSNAAAGRDVVNPPDTGVRVDMYNESAGYGDVRESVRDTGDKPAYADAASAIDTWVSAIGLFVEAYNTLLAAIHKKMEALESEASEKDQAELFRQTAEALRAAVYQPVDVDSRITGTRRVSLYEMGVAHSPNYRKAGRLTVQDEKLRAALLHREEDAKTLFAKNDNSLTVRLQGLLSAFMTQIDPEDLNVSYTQFFTQCICIKDLFS